MSIVEGLGPIIDNNSRVLILGSMPSEMSLSKGEYYSNPANQFWKILFSIFDTGLEQSYPAKMSFLKDGEIALWDVIRRCEREGSSDSKITKVQVNDFNALLQIYPEIQNLFFNGKEAFNIFQREVRLDEKVNRTLLPSSSPANARISLEKKINKWGKIRTL
jgi:hypoxanthine-DNA glycosylase